MSNRARPEFKYVAIGIRDEVRKTKRGFEKVSRVHHGFAHGGSLLEVGATEHRLRVLETLNLSPLDNDAA